MPLRLKLLIGLLIVFGLMSGWIIYRAYSYWNDNYRVGEIPPEITQALGVRDIPLSSMKPPALQSGDQIRYGGATSVISVIEFGDYECQYCRTMAKRIDSLLPSYRGRVRFVWRDFPISEKHTRALPAAVFARCAGEQGHYWEAYDRLMTSDLSESDMRVITQVIGLDAERMNACRKDPAVKAAIAQSVRESREMGVKSAPFMFVGTQAFDSALSEEDLEKAINRALTSL